MLFNYSVLINQQPIVLWTFDHTCCLNTVLLEFIAYYELQWALSYQAAHQEPLQHQHMVPNVPSLKGRNI